MDKTRMYDYFLPAEWHPQSGIQLTWPHDMTDWKPYLDRITATFVDMARIIAAREKVVIVSPDTAAVKSLLAKELPEEMQPNLLYFTCNTNDTWARDHAFVTLLRSPQSEKPVSDAKLLDFRFNGWGEKFEADKDNAINCVLYSQGVFEGVMEDHLDFVLEGGAIESDGHGTVFTTSQCLLAPHRNQPLDRNRIEKQLKQRLCADRIVWLDHGSLIGDDTDGHIDTIVRVAPSDILLYIRCEDKNDEHFGDFKALEEQLKALRTPGGHPYKLLPLPLPDAIYDDGERLPATYANFLIINGAVIYPTYAQPDKDEQARRQIQLAFPDREIIGVDARTVIRQHGSLHCLTMQFPAGVIREG